MMNYALLCGSAPNDYWQKKIISMYNFLLSDKGGSIPDKNICMFPNGIEDVTIEIVLNNILSGKAGDIPNGIFIYICSQYPVSDDENSVWLGNIEIKKNMIAKYQTIASDSGIDFQIIYDTDKSFISDETLGYEKVV